MEMQFGSEIIQSYKRLSYEPWYALAEFVDNSTEASFRNESALKSQFAIEDRNLTISISYDEAADTITITDNSLGMSKEELINALTVGKVPSFTKGRSRYGLGMKTAACWLGNLWTLKTKKLDDAEEHSITIDVDQIAKHNTDVNHQSIAKPPKEHYTIITISKLNHVFRGRTIGKIKDFLRSMYRKDFEKHKLELFWQGEKLEWDNKKMIYDKLHKNKDGQLMMKDFDFLVGEDGNKKKVYGWVGVFEKGSRRDAGFSIIQCDRVIKGWPNAYRPETLFGEGGGRNDLTNQRLVGEIFLDEFAVSHTKDEIIFLHNEKDELESLLFDKCVDFKNFALEYRKYLDDERVSTVNDGSRALNEFEKEINSSEFHDKLLATIPEVQLLNKVKDNLVEAVTKRMIPSLKAIIDKLEILVYLDSKLSPNDPYVLIESTKSANYVIVIINLAHPHWLYLKGPDSVLNFIRHCVYDGVSEWKAHFKLSRLDPDTIKKIKDDLLRVPLEIEEHE